jgi:hypothetical protein
MDPRDLTLVLARILGPAGPPGPEVGCEACFGELDRFVELELAGEDADGSIPGLRAHLAGCPAPAARSTRASTHSSAANEFHRAERGQRGPLPSAIASTIAAAGATRRTAPTPVPAYMAIDSMSPSVDAVGWASL